MNTMFKPSDSDKPISIAGPVCVQHAGAKGRGVFALKAIKKGELIERCPVVVVPIEQREFIDKTKLYNYYYAWEPDDEGVAITLGYGSLYNHSYKPNAIFVRDLEGEFIDYIAYKDINPGDEITVNYNGEPEDQEELPYLTVEES